MKSFKIGRIAGIEVKIHVTLFIILIILIYILYTNPFPWGFGNLKYSPQLRLTLSALETLMIFFAIFIHELAHSIFSKKSGIEVKEIVLFIFGGVAFFEEIPRDPKKEIIISLAGPLASFILAFTGLIIFYMGVGVISKFFKVFGYFNLILAVFNLIPAFPLDGGRILRSLLALKFEYINATKIAAEIGKGLAIVMGISGLLVNPWLILIALFIYIGANEEERLVIVEHMLRKLKVREIMTENPIVVSPESTVEEVVNLMFKRKHLGYPVLKDEKLVGIVTLHDLAKAKRNERIENVMTREVITISPEKTAFEAFRIMNKHRIGRLPVVENDKLVGIISRTDLMKILEMFEVLKSV